MIYVALGDSTGVGIGAVSGGYPARLASHLRAAGRDARLVNLCVSGATSGELLRYQLPRVQKEKPDLVSVGIGINDVTHGVTAAVYAKHMTTIVEQLLAQTRARLVLPNLPNFKHAPAIPPAFRDGIEEHVQAFNHEIERLVAKRDRVILVNIHDHSDYLAERPDFFSRDGFHPSDAGYQYWADLMWKAIENG